MPKIVIAVAVITGIGIIGLFWLKWLGVVIGCFGIYLILSYVITFYILGRRKAPDLQKILKLKGSENALDVGCGLGRMAIGVAKWLTTGK
ncbi:MAG: hypothetical protein QMC90_03795, partial [Dehalococcoidales bacterium]|nr:hypothetical protein [Dehalococcoidales bacterium]